MLHVPASCFADVLGEHVDLSASERDALAGLEERTRAVRRGAILQRENEPCGELYVLRKGLMMSYVLLDDGSRQILRLLFPGDMIGVGNLIYRDSLETLAAQGQLSAYRHTGFWQPMDTLRDKTQLEAHWASGHAPWRVWSPHREHP